MATAMDRFKQWYADRAESSFRKREESLYVERTASAHTLPGGSGARYTSGGDRYKNREVNDLAGQTTRMAASAASETMAREHELQKQINEIKAEMTVASVSGKDEVLPAHRGSGGNLFALRYRNDTQRDGTEIPRYQGTAGSTHQLEYIEKSSPYDTEATEANGFNTFWPDSSWTVVPGAEAVALDL